MKICRVEGCESIHRAKGFCNKHWKQHRKYGRILPRSRNDLNEMTVRGDTAFITLYKNYEPIAEALIDSADVELVRDMHWGLTMGYVKTSSRSLPIHQVIMGTKYIDHINRNPLDNRRRNLRIATHADNMRNIAISRHNKSGFKGVSFENYTKKWKAVITIDNKPFTIGRFKEPEEAAYVYDQFAITLNKEFSFTNFEY